MMKVSVIAPMTGGTPDFGGLPHTGNVLIARTPTSSYGLYILTGTTGQVNAIEALPQVIGLCDLTNPRFNDWPELDVVVGTTVRTQLNTWLAEHGKPTIPAGTLYRAVFAWLLRYYRDNDLDLLEHTLAAAFRTAVNTMLTAHDLPNVPTGYTYWQLAKAIDERLLQRWAELGDTIDPAVRTRINTWAQNHGYPQIPADFTNRQTIVGICNVFGMGDIDLSDVLE